jgi:hypothetical protein
MPIVFRESGLRYFFFSNEGAPREAPHVHVKGGGRDAIWLKPDVAIADSYGFNSGELARILRIVLNRRDVIMRAWHEHFGNGDTL